MKFKSKSSDMEIEFNEKWAWIFSTNEKVSIALGNYPNARWKLIEKALKYAKEKQ